MYSLYITPPLSACIVHDCREGRGVIYREYTECYSISFLFLFFFHQSSLYPTSNKNFILKYFRCRDGKRTETRIGMEGICITHSCIPLYTVYMQHIMALSGGMQDVHCMNCLLWLHTMEACIQVYSCIPASCTLSNTKIDTHVERRLTPLYD